MKSYFSYYIKICDTVQQMGTKKGYSQYLNKESIPFVVTLNGLDCYILSFPHSFEDNPKSPSANSLKTKNMEN